MFSYGINRSHTAENHCSRLRTRKLFPTGYRKGIVVGHPPDITRGIGERPESGAEAELSISQDEDLQNRSVQAESSPLWCKCTTRDDQQVVLTLFCPRKN